MRLSLVLLACGFCTMIVEIFVLQTPYSPYQIALPMAPFAQLRETAIVLSLFGLALAANTHRFAPANGGEPWVLFGLYAVGSLGSVITLIVAASLGMNAVQIIDPRPGSSLIFAVRALFASILLSALVVVLRQAFRRSPKP